MLSDVKGQDEGVRFLRCVVEGQLTSPLLLLGDAGVGRYFSVTEAAKEVFQGEAQHYQIDHGVHPDFCVVRPEADKDIKVDSVRDLVEKAGTKPTWAPVKFLVIDGVDYMTSAASNALLKVLEEAPGTVRFFLLAEESKRVLPTIRSRCVELRYRRLPEAFVVEKLLQHIDDRTKALVICRLADGSVGRAVRLLGSGGLSLRDRMYSLLKLGMAREMSQLFAAVDTLDTDLVLGMRFLEHLACDLVMLPHTPTHITNLDLMDGLRDLRKGLGATKIVQLRAALKVVWPRLRGPYNRSFHVKTMLATAFA